MNSKASLKGTGWIQLYKKECSLDYSRHLCARKRSAELNNKRRSKSFGNRDTIETPKQRIDSRLSNTFQTTHTMPGGQSFARTPQVYHVPGDHLEETSNTAVKAVKATKWSIGHRQKA